MSEVLNQNLHRSNDPVRGIQTHNQIRIAHGLAPELSIAVTNGTRKQLVLESIGVRTLHSESDVRRLYNDADSQSREPSQWLNPDEMKEVGERGEQWWNGITGTAEHGLYYPSGYEPFSYTAGAAAAKLAAIDSYLVRNGQYALFRHNLVAVDWHSSHGLSRQPQTVENKPLDHIDALSNRLRRAQKQRESFYSSFAMAIRRPDGKMSVVETLVRCGILNPDIPFDTIQKYVVPNRYDLPAGMDLYDAMKDLIIVNDEPDGLHSAMRRWYYQGGVPAQIWRKCILPRRYDIAARAEVYVPLYEKLITSVEHRRLDLKNDADNVKEIFFGNFD